MIFRQLKLGPMQNFSYIIGDEMTKEAAVVDAGWEAEKIIKIADENKLRIKKIILTHSHYDHMQKISELAEKTNAAVYVHEASKKSSFSKMIFLVKEVKDNDEIKIGNVKIKVIHTPGHTPESICLLVKNKLLTGDTLFVNAIGRTDLAGGDAIKLFESLQKLKKLDDDVEVYPGHDYGDAPFSTIGNEKKNNPYFKCETKGEFLNLLL